MPPQPKKVELARALLEETSIFIHLDPRRPGVVVPAQFRAQPELVLQFGFQMRVPILDLELDDEFLTGTLSFARRPFWCRIPWTSVFAIIGEDKRGLVWPEDAPAESRIHGVSAPAPEAKRSHLRAVGLSDAPPPASATPTTSSPTEDAQNGEGQEGECGVCAATWLEDAAACPVCGSTREEAFVAKPSAADASREIPLVQAGESLIPTVPPQVSLRPLALAVQPAPAAATEGDDDSEKKDDGDDDDKPPPEGPKNRSHLRLVK